jgi:hypothetical protein
MNDIFNMDLTDGFLGLPASFHTQANTDGIDLVFKICLQIAVPSLDQEQYSRDFGTAEIPKSIAASANGHFE